jgi:hypothetical protein
MCFMTFLLKEHTAVGGLLPEDAVDPRCAFAANGLVSLAAARELWLPTVDLVVAAALGQNARLRSGEVLGDMVVEAARGQLLVGMRCLLGMSLAQQGYVSTGAFLLEGNRLQRWLACMWARQLHEATLALLRVLLQAVAGGGGDTAVKEVCCKLVIGADVATQVRRVYPWNVRTSVTGTQRAGQPHCSSNSNLPA